MRDGLLTIFIDSGDGLNFWTFRLQEEWPSTVCILPWTGSSRVRVRWVSRAPNPSVRPPPCAPPISALAQPSLPASTTRVNSVDPPDT